MNFIRKIVQSHSKEDVALHGELKKLLNFSPRKIHKYKKAFTHRSVQITDEKGNPIRGRKESLAKALGEELGFETFLEEIQKENSPVNNAFVANQELLGAIMADNLVESYLGQR